MCVYQHIAQRAGWAPVRPLCWVLRVALASYFGLARRQAPPAEPAWQVTVHNAFGWHSRAA